MKLVLVASTPWSIIPFRGKLISGLYDRGIEVHICAPFTEGDNGIVQELKNNYNVQTHTTPLGKTGINMFSDFRYLMKLIEIMTLVKPNFLLCYTMKPVIYGSIAGWVAKVPARFSMITGLGFLFIESQGVLKRGVQFIGTSLLWFSLLKNHKLFFQNIDDKNLFLDRNLISSKKPTCVVNGSGVDLVHYDERPLPSHASFLLIARMIQNKGIREYIEAIRLVKKSHPKVKFCMVGGIEENIDGVDPKEIQSWVVEGLVDYKGALSDVRPEIENCSVFVLPSYREGTPRSVLEAMSMGRAVITTDVPGCRDTVRSGLNGFLVRPKDCCDLADAMRRLIEDEKLRAAMGEKSREYAVKKYSDVSVAAEIMAGMGI